MHALWRFLDDLWNIRWVKGHRTQVAMAGLKLSAAILTYQTVATAPDLIQAGMDLPDLPAQVLLWLSPLPAYFAAKIDQFTKEHQL